MSENRRETWTSVESGDAQVLIRPEGGREIGKVGVRPSKGGPVDAKTCRASREARWRVLHQTLPRRPGRSRRSRGPSCPGQSRACRRWATRRWRRRSRRRRQIRRWRAAEKASGLGCSPTRGSRGLRWTPSGKMSSSLRTVEERPRSRCPRPRRYRTRKLVAESTGGRTSG